jgi:serine protease Do
MKAKFALFALAGLTALSGQAQEKASPPPGIEKAVEAVFPALVRIHVVTLEGEEGVMRKLRASGSGAIISEEGHVLTNHHVAGRATRVVCRTADREEIDAEVIGTDVLTDLCVLKLDLASRSQPSKKLPIAKFGNSDQLKVGDTVLAMGSPRGLAQSVTSGIVANVNMILPNSTLTIDGENVGQLVRWIGHDAIIQPGNSGGPLVNLAGEIIGVNEIGTGPLGGAIPSNLAQSVIPELIQNGTKAWSSIGLTFQPLLKTSHHEKGILVADVLPGTAAEKAGVKAGDILTSLDGQDFPLCTSEEDVPVANRIILATPVGKKVKIEGLRDDKAIAFELVTEPREPARHRERELKAWGITARDLTLALAVDRGLKNARGVYVDGVRPSGPAAACKPALVPGDVILKLKDREITKLNELEKISSELTQDGEAPASVLVTFQRGSQQMLTVARIGPDEEDENAALAAKAWFGATSQVLTSDLAEAIGLDGKKGVRITTVVPGSAADAAGVKPGDVIVKLDGQVIAAQNIGDETVFGDLIRQYKPGAEVELDAFRDGGPMKFNVKLLQQPKQASELPKHTDTQFEFTATELSVSDRHESRLPTDLPGVRITTVESAGWAALGGLRERDVLLSIDGKPTGSIDELKSVLAALKQAKPRRVALFVRRGMRTTFVELEPKW